MAALLDTSDAPAVVGKSTGYWLSQEDFNSTEEGGVKELGKVGFPRDWPAVYTSSKALKSLIGKKGKCAGKKVAVVPVPTSEEAEQVKSLKLHPLQSFLNAERVQEATGFSVVKGWAVFEHLDKDVSAAFVAERFWWNALPDGKWVDYTPRPEDWPELLLAEAASEDTKSKAKLSSQEADIAAHLLKLRYGITAPPPVAKATAQAQAVAAATVSESTKTQSAAVTIQKAAPVEAKPLASKAEVAAREAKAPSAVRELLPKVKAGEVEAMKKLMEKVKSDEELAVLITSEELVTPIVAMLNQEANREDALKLLLYLTDAGVGQKCQEVRDSVLAAGAASPLAALLSSGTSSFEELAAAIIGNLCHESPANQGAVAAAGVFKPLINLLKKETGPAQEAAYALWNLTVGHEENSTTIVELGAVPLLTELLKSSSDIAQENAAGALMHVTMSEDAGKAVVEAGAIPRLVQLLEPTCEPEVSSQAAGALLNLASDNPEYAKMIERAGGIRPLIRLVRNGPDLAKEYAAGALMNLIRGDLDVAEAAAAEGAIPAFAWLLSKGTGRAEALGALANLASSSAERQIAIYKAQVTRRSVAFLSDPNVDVRRSAAALIMNLAPHAKIKERIVEANALRPLVAMLKDPDEAGKARAAGALANLFNDHSANVHAGYEQAADMIPFLIDILKTEGNTEEAKRQAAHALGMLAAEDAPCDAVWSAGAGPPLLALLKDKVAEAALGVMNLSWRWPEVKQDIAQGSTIDDLIEMLNSGDGFAREYAAGALMNITAGSTENAEKAVGAVPALSKLLLSDAIQAAEWAAGALANIARAGPEAQKQAVKTGAETRLAALLHKATTGGSSLVLLALTSLAENEAPAVQKALKAQEKAKLKEFQVSGSEELQDFTNVLVQKLQPDFKL